jgi:hypothetical protein
MSAEAVRRAIEAFSAEKIGPFEAAALLYATWQTESGGVADPPPRYEAAYDKGGRYAGGSFQPELLRTYGREAAQSWGPFQLMPVVAWELGFKYPPRAFLDPHLAAQVVLEYYRRRVVDRGASTPEEAYDAYNSGTHRDRRSSAVQRNVDRFMSAWKTFYATVKPALPAAGGALLLILAVLAVIALSRKPTR